MAVGRGFLPIRDMSGGDYTGAIQQYVVPASHATLLAIGDLVKSLGTASAAGTVINGEDVAGVENVDQADASNTALIGAVTSFLPNFSNLEQSGLPASTAGVALIAIDALTLYEVPVSNGTVALADVGNNADFANTTATLTGGLALSNMSLDAGTIDTTATLPLRIVGIKDGDLTSAQTIFVRLNNPEAKNTTGV